jgi:hypothetical protein
MPDAPISNLWLPVNLAPERRRSRARLAAVAVAAVLAIIWRMTT